RILISAPVALMRRRCASAASAPEGARCIGGGRISRSRLVKPARSEQMAKRPAGAKRPLPERGGERARRHSLAGWREVAARVCFCGGYFGAAPPRTDIASGG